MMFLCHIQADGSPGDSWKLTDRPFVVGRDDFVDASIEDDSLSRSHFLITCEGGEFLVIDLNSSNGILLNGEWVSANKLRSGDRIMAGNCMFWFSDVPVSGAFQKSPALLPWTASDNPAASNAD